ncbi:MAG: transcriptional regulator of protocatechuate catabolism PcaQ [Rhodobacteraceae bacterium HLUCCA08]|nr:MAG: transcriptional regulator of protocatechuate catabolism PcaQ [Rhodobacteraceae bacterium HLUCCA08]
MDRRIKFRHLDAFSSIARAGSLKRAADALHLSQPAISKTLKELEDIVGATLMARDRSGATLTQEGEVFLQFAEQCTAALRHGLRSVRSGGAAAAHLKVGVLPSVASGLLPEAAAGFARNNPDTLLEIHEGPHQDLTARLRAGRLDLVVGRLGRPESMQGLVFRQLYTEEVVVVAAPASPAVTVRHLEGLDAFRVLYPPADSAIRPLVARMLIARGVPLFKNRIETASAAFGRSLVVADPETVWIISRGVVANELAEGRLVRLDIDTSPTVGAVGVMSVADEVPTPEMRAFTTAVSRVAGDRR